MRPWYHILGSAVFGIRILAAPAIYWNNLSVSARLSIIVEPYLFLGWLYIYMLCGRYIYICKLNQIKLNQDYSQIRWSIWSSNDFFVVVDGLSSFGDVYHFHTSLMWRPIIYLASSVSHMALKCWNWAHFDDVRQKPLRCTLIFRDGDQMVLSA